MSEELKRVIPVREYRKKYMEPYFANLDSAPGYYRAFKIEDNEWDDNICESNLRCEITKRIIDWLIRTIRFTVGGHEEGPYMSAEV